MATMRIGNVQSVCCYHIVYVW